MSDGYPKIAVDSVVWTELDGEIVLLNVETGSYFGLDDVGSRIWQLLAQGNTEERVIEVLTEEYDVSPETVRADLAIFLETLAAHRLAQPPIGASVGAVSART